MFAAGLVWGRGANFRNPGTSGDSSYGREIRNGHISAEHNRMKFNTYRFLAPFALTALGLTLAACQEPAASTAPAAAPAAPASSTTTVIEEVPRGHDDRDAHRVPDRVDPRPDPDHRDHPDDDHR